MESMERVARPNPEFWRGRNVLVTGHTGFKGSWLAHWLLQMGARVTGIALAPNTQPNLFSILDLQSRLQHQVVDIRNLQALREALQKAEPEIVLHLAAQPLVRLSYRNPLETFETNVLGTANVLEIVRNLPSVRGCLVVTSDKCYENREWAWPYRETDALGGVDPYSSSKACAEIVAHSYRRAFAFAGGAWLVTARAGNVIGFGDWSEDRIVPDMVRAYSESQPLRLRNPGAIRPWQHVIEPVSGYLVLAEKAAAGELQGNTAFNLGPAPHQFKTVLELVERFSAEWGMGCSWNVESAPEGWKESGRLVLDSSLAQAVLGWRGVLGFEQSVRWTARAYHRFAHGASAIEMRGAIDDFLASYQS